jgi:multidrug efflux pump subunit AcrA (membrane-fusion protein)
MRGKAGAALLLTVFVFASIACGDEGMDAADCLAAEVEDVRKQLTDAARTGDAQRVAELLEEHPDIPMHRSGRQPLHWAAQGGHIEMTLTLLQYGAEPNVHAENDNTPLLLAREPEIVQMLIEHGADLEARRGEIALQRAQSELDVWNSYRGPAMLKNAELSVRSMENFVSNQREELEQLEKMYEGTELDTETKEIVLERARRSYAIAQERLVLTRNDHHITTEFTHPQRTEDVHNDVGFREEALAHLQINNAIALARKRAEIESLETSIDETQLRLSRLRGDREQFVMRAPATGLMTTIDLQTGDAVNARHVIATIHDPSQKKLRVELTAADLRVLSEGDAIDLQVPEFPELALTGAIESSSPIGRARGDETVFDGEVHVVGENPLLRLGLRITGRAERTLEDVLAVPRKAITERDGRFFVTVDRDGEHEEREITIGPRNDKKAQVVRGLDEGDQIVLPEKE